MRKIKLNITDRTFQNYFKDLKINVRIKDYSMLIDLIKRSLVEDNIEELGFISAEYLIYLIQMGDLNSSLIIDEYFIPSKDILELSMFLYLSGDLIKELKHEYKNNLSIYDIRVAQRLTQVINSVLSEEEKLKVSEDLFNLLTDYFESKPLYARQYILLILLKPFHKIKIFNICLIFSNKLWYN